MNVTDSPQKLAQKLIVQGNRLIAVDGAHGSGKSTLASELAVLLGAKVIGGDSFLRKNRGTFFENLDLELLRDAIDPTNICILESICLRQIVQALSIKPDSFIYVKRMARWGWADEDELVPVVPIEEHLARLKNQATMFLDGPEHEDLGLWDEVIRYHANFAPDKHSDFIFLRSDA